jgi:predicted nucleic acid-binding protein
MRVYADSGALLKLYFYEPESERAVSAISGATLLYHDLHDVEVRNAIRLGVFRKRIDGRIAEQMLAALDQDLAAGVYEACGASFAQIARRSEALSANHTATLGIRAIDLMHVAVAQISRADSFFTFDERQLRLAEAASLHCLR